MAEEKLSSEDIINLLNKSKLKANILWYALDYMQSYNGRTKADCVALAMDYDIRNYENGEHYYIKKG
jgi:hypothetical protein